MEDSKRFINLTSSYREFLDKIDSILQYDVTTNSKTLNKIHNKIDDIKNLCNLHNSDVNRLLLYCDNTHPTLKKFKDYVILKNVNFLKKVIKDPKYTTFLNNIHTTITTILNRHIDKKHIEEALVSLWNKYLEYWDGYWHSIEVSKNGKIKNIEIVDPYEFEELINLVRKKK